MEEFTEQEKIARSKKMMLWFGIVSLIMGFAGWTSAYIVSSSREDWLNEFKLPTEFYFSAFVLFISSLSYIMAKRSVKEDRAQQATLYLVATFLLGILFVTLQISGFYSFIDLGYYFTGPTSNVTISFIYIIALMHIVHLLAGFISLGVVIVNQVQGRYDAEHMLGLELGATFWHFLDLLWIYLVLFFHFFN